MYKAIISIISIVTSGNSMKGQRVEKHRLGFVYISIFAFTARGGVNGPIVVR